MVANIIEGGKTPVLGKQELADMDFQLILYPLTSLFAAAAVICGILSNAHAGIRHFKPML